MTENSETPWVPGTVLWHPDMDDAICIVGDDGYPYIAGDPKRPAPFPRANARWEVIGTLQPEGTTAVPNDVCKRVASHLRESASEVDAPEGFTQQIIRQMRADADILDPPAPEPDLIDVEVTITATMTLGAPYRVDLDNLDQVGRQMVEWDSNRDDVGRDVLPRLKYQQTTVRRGDDRP